MSPTTRKFPQFRHSIVLVFVLLLVTALSGGVTHAQDNNLEATLDRIAKETSVVRGLPPLEEIDDVLLTRDNILAQMPELIADESDPEELAAQSRSLAALGLIPAGTDLLDLTIRLMGEQAAGYYDPITDEMIVVTDGDFRAEEYFYAHEVVHALQDAHLDPYDLMEETESDNSDELLARIALYEGDAVATSDAYLSNHPDVAMALLREAMNDFPELRSAPGAMSAILIFPYVAGEPFVNRLRGEGGWDAVNAAYTDMPASTEQILHAAKYIERDQPATVPLPDPESTLGPGWSTVDEDTLGEFQTAVLLANLEPGDGFNGVTGNIDLPEAARNAAAGWDGDRFALWEDEAGEQEVLVWRSVWDTPQDARAFSRALAQFEERRWDGDFNGESPDDVSLVTADVAARIVVDEQEVLYTRATELPLVDTAIGALRNASAPNPLPGPR